MEENDDDDVEVTGWRKETPKLLVECPICHKSLPSQNALWVHCDERHQGRREAVVLPVAVCATVQRSNRDADWDYRRLLLQISRGKARPSVQWHTFQSRPSLIDRDTRHCHDVDSPDSPGEATTEVGALSGMAT
jgi:hypothetical protein